MLKVKPFKSKATFIQQVFNEVPMLAINSCTLALAIFDVKHLENHKTREILGDVIILASLWISLSANLFLSYTLIKGFKIAYHTTKTHNSKGFTQRLLVFLSASDVRAGDLGLTTKQEETKQTEQKTEKETQAEFLRIDTLSVDQQNFCPAYQQKLAPSTL